MLLQGSSLRDKGCPQIISDGERKTSDFWFVILEDVYFMFKKSRKGLLSIVLAAVFCFNTVSAAEFDITEDPAAMAQQTTLTVTAVPENVEAATEEPKVSEVFSQIQTTKPTPVSGNPTEAIIYEFLVDNMGLSSAAASGVIANIQYESGFVPTKVGDHGTSYGICQWHNGRFSRLRRYCSQNGFNYKTIEGQLHYLRYELEKYYPQVLAYLKSIPNTYSGAYDAAYYWCYNFEIPSNRKYKSDERGRLSQNLYWQNYGKVTETVATLSAESLALHYSEKNSAGATISFGGTLPKSYKLSAKVLGEDIAVAFGAPNGASFPINVSMKTNSQKTHEIEISLIDNATGKVVLTKTLSVSTEIEYTLITMNSDGSGFIMAMSGADALASPIPEETYLRAYDANSVPTPAPEAPTSAKKGDDVLPPQGRNPINPGRSGRFKS